MFSLLIFGIFFFEKLIFLFIFNYHRFIITYENLNKVLNEYFLFL